MPCQSYTSNWASDSTDRDVQRLKAEADKLARIACEALTELEKAGKADFLILKNDELREWWEAHKEADRKEKARVAEKERQERVKQEALDRLTDEEKELLGLKKPAAKRHKKFNNPNVWDDPNEVEEIEYILDDLKQSYNLIMKRK